MKSCRVPFGAGIDTGQRINRATAKKLVEAKYQVFFRYVPRVITTNIETDRYWPNDLIVSELSWCLDEGAKISPVQYCNTANSNHQKGARLSRSYGEEVGRAAADYCQRLKLPEGITIWCDAENWPKATWAMARAFLNGWSFVVRAMGYNCGLYCGAGLHNLADGSFATWRERMDAVGRNLYSLPRFRAYWSSLSAYPPIPVRDYTVCQGGELKLFGLTVDQDIIRLDCKSKPSTRWRVVTA